MARLSKRPLRGLHSGALLGSLALVAALQLSHAPGPVVAVNRDEVRILAGEPGTFDPAAGADITTAAVTAQLYETLTTYDAALTLQPALRRAGMSRPTDGVSSSTCGRTWRSRTGRRSPPRTWSVAGSGSSTRTRLHRLPRS